MTRNLEEFNGAYKDKVAFVVGAGPSLHFQDLSPLSNFLTIAVNSGCLAVPDADFFVSDDWSVSRWSYFIRNLKHSKTTLLLYEKMLKKYAAPFGDRAVLFRHRSGYHITDKYDHNDYDLHLMQARSSIGTAIHIAHIMGCSKIVLLGVDGIRVNNCRYFWQFDRRKYQVNRIDGVSIDPHKKIRYGGTATDEDLVDIQHYWDTFVEKLGKEVSILNGSPMSAIDIFPKVSLSEFMKEHKDGSIR